MNCGMHCGGGWYERVGIPSEQMDEEMRQMDVDHLLSPEYVRFFLRHILQIGIVKTTVKAAPCLDDNVCQKIALHLVNAQDALLKKAHGLVVALERDNHQIRRSFSRCAHIVKLVGLVEYHIPLFQSVGGFPGNYVYLSFVYTWLLNTYPSQRDYYAQLV